MLLSVLSGTMQRSTLSRRWKKDCAGQSQFDWEAARKGNLGASTLTPETTEALFLLCLPAKGHLAENALRFLIGKTGRITLRLERLEDRESAQRAIAENLKGNGSVYLVIEPEHVSQELLTELQGLRQFKGRIKVVALSKDPFWGHHRPDVQLAIRYLGAHQEHRILEPTESQPKRHFNGAVAFYKELLGLK